MRQSWTDDRLDDLRNDVHEFRTETKAEFVAVRNESRDECRALRAEMAAGFNQMSQRFDRLFQAMIGFGGLTIASLIGFMATQL